ncbi:MAG TPA: Ig-like domain-containing protein, partial [Patescibacteria group bacterium]|nr:Ig-like domain-containing protein [Patescibacteria group bacterium]
SGQSTDLGQDGAAFLGWSPSGLDVMYASAGGITVADVNGKSLATLPQGAPSWSSKDAILVGSDTSLAQAPPDGSTVMKLADGTYGSPAWAPDAATFAFVRGSGLWVATAPSLPAPPGILDQAAGVVNTFMQARLDNHPDKATALLDDQGKKAYAPGALNLTISGDPSFTRFYILAQEITGTAPDTATFVVRLVLSHGKIDVSDREETLTLVRDPDSNQFVIDGATPGAHRDLGKGAEVVGVDLGRTSVKVSFDSDLDPATVSRGVYVLDAQGHRVEARVGYDSKVVKISGLELKPGARYTLVVSTSVKDVLGHNVASEYDLVIVGPVSDSGTSGGGVITTPSPSPSPAPTTSPAG